MSAGAASDFSSTTSAEISEELEEAAFYFEQGLYDEAEAIYRRVVQRAPNHPVALLRLGEIAVTRGQDAASPVGDGLETAELETDAPVAGLHDIEPPDDLDLTAREFGPGSAWRDEKPGSDAVDVPAAPEPERDATADDFGAGIRTSLLDEPTPDAVTADAAAIEPSIAVEPDLAPELDLELEPEAEPEPEPELVPEPEPASIAAAQPELLPEPELTAPEMAVAEDASAPAFDLAAELSESITDAPAPATASSASTDEDGFASLFSDFKRGVSRTLGEGDVETHFDLGIAYREMGLLEDAIGEFHYALSSSARRLDALHMMGLCAIDLGRALDAIAHLEQALASPDVPAERETALRFDLGRAHEANGDRERALDAFRRVVELDPGFQDAAARIETLLAAPAAIETDDETGDGEAYESFDDLVAEGTDETLTEAEAPATEVYESFEEFLSDDEDDENAAAVEVAEAAVTAAAEPVIEDVIEEAAADEAVAAEAIAEEHVAREPEAEPAVEDPAPAPVEPDPPPGPSRRRKVSFF